MNELAKCIACGQACSREIEIVTRMRSDDVGITAYVCAICYDRWAELLFQRSDRVYLRVR